MSDYQTVARFALPAVIPPADSSQPRDDWENIGTNLMQTARSGEISKPAQFYATMVTAYRANSPADFNQAVAAYRLWLGDRFTPQLNKAGQEYFFSTFQPFYKAHGHLRARAACWRCSRGSAAAWLRQTRRRHSAFPNCCGGRRFTLSGWRGSSTPSASCSACILKAVRR